MHTLDIIIIMRYTDISSLTFWQETCRGGALLYVYIRERH